VLQFIIVLVLAAQFSFRWLARRRPTGGDGEAAQGGEAEAA
jgi:hypothetical protein